MSGWPARRNRTAAAAGTPPAARKPKQPAKPKLTPMEADLLTGVLELCELLRLFVYHSYDSITDRCPGLPDLIIVGPGGVLWRELKSARGGFRPGQPPWLLALHLAGQDVGVWRPADMVSQRIAAELQQIARFAPGYVPQELPAWLATILPADLIGDVRRWPPVPVPSRT